MTDATTVQMPQRWDGWIRLGHNPPQLGYRLHQKDTGHDWIPGEMPPEEVEVSRRDIFGLSPETGLKGQKPGDEPELGSVGECPQRLVEDFSHG